jgi:hypothetical protein
MASSSVDMLQPALERKLPYRIAGTKYDTEVLGFENLESY